MPVTSLDCLIIGGGPAGLTAAIYLARYHLNVAVIDAGDSRAALIPCTRNHAGFPDGISGPELIARMAQQARKYGARVTAGVVEMLARDGDDFAATVALPGGDRQRITAHCVLLATGVTNNRPDMPGALHDRALASGRIRYCPVCDGYEVSDSRVAVIGTGDHGVREALFLRAFTDDLSLIAPHGPHKLSDEDVARLADAGVAAIAGPPRDFEIEDAGIAVTTGAGRLRFDSIYPALGSVIRSKLAVAIGADASPDGCLAVDAHQRSSVPGLYAAGDVVLGLDQISHAMGEAGVAATTMRNDLAKRLRLFR